ncbi:uncharacterized protein LOC135470530 [Liolophura sinensis]|uniref:uncharacterized protein LOC135470530 n=1 Tax=Liolophura sinensis TaxID=3198878 RepID=UPI003158D903
MCDKTMYYHVFFVVLQSCLVIRGDEASEATVDPKIKTMQTAFSSFEVIPTTTLESTVNGSTNVTTITTRMNGDGEEGQTESSPSLDDMTCKDIVRKCGPKLINNIANDEGEDEDLLTSPDDICKRAFHCFQTVFERMSLRRRAGRRHPGHAGHEDDEHTVLNHLGELIGTFGTGIVIGVFMALLIVNLMKRRGHQPSETRSREDRSDSKAGFPGMLRGPMPPPALSSEGIYTEGPIIMPHTKYDRASSKGLYEELDGNESGSPKNGHRPSSKESGQSVHNVYFVLEVDPQKGEEESEKEEDADNMPNEDMENNSETGVSSVNRLIPQPKARKPRKPPRRPKSDTEESKL